MGRSGAQRRSTAQYGRGSRAAARRASDSMPRESEPPTYPARMPAIPLGAAGLREDVRLLTAAGLRRAAGPLVALALAVLLCACGGDSHRDPTARAASADDVTSAGTVAPTTHPAPDTPLAPAASAARPTLLPSPRPRGRAVRLTIAAAPGGEAAPGDFLGLSFELRSLPLIAGYAAPHGDLVTLLRSLGPGVLRFGGVSADEQAAWVAPGEARPAWASTEITPSDLAGVARLARETGWRVLLTVNLGHYDPRAAAQEAAAARSALGPALTGIEIGNEPDRFLGKRLRAGGWDIAAYRSQALAYRTAIETAAPGISIAGPDPATGVAGLAWLNAAAHTLHPSLLTDHYYPLSSCGYKPTVGELLSPGLRRGTGAMLAKMRAIAHSVRAPLRIDETNSISCEGRPGVSDTFASALWALDYIARTIDAGVTGLNFHDLLAKLGSYSPLLGRSAAAVSAGELHAQPEWYALLAARELPGSRPLPVHVAGAASGELSAHAFRAPDGRLRIVLVDFEPPGSRPLAIGLRLPGGTHRRYARGSILRLVAPSPAATGGVRLAGRAVAADGSWTAPSALPAVYSHRGRLALQLAPASAAVVTLYPS